MIDFEAVARVAHDANAAYCRSIGDKSQPKWDNAPDWQRKSAIEGARFLFLNPGTQPGVLHEQWAEQKLADGWTWGETKDPEAKTHPCLVPFAQLPEEQQRKDILFAAVCKAMFPQDAPEIGRCFLEANNKLGGQGGVLMVKLPTGAVGYVSHGMSNGAVNALLALGIHLNMNDHDRKVAAGLAGKEAQERLAEIEAFNRANTDDSVATEQERSTLAGDPVDGALVNGGAHAD